jgi:hypothetical protein
MYDRIPDWGTQSIVGYTQRYLLKNAWRARSEMDLDDLMQDAYLLYVKMQSRYGDDSPAIFMARWKRALYNRLYNHCSTGNAKGRRRTVSLRRQHNCGHVESGYLEVEIREHRRRARAPIRCLFQELELRPQKQLRVPSDPRRLNKYLCKLARLPDWMPLYQLLESWVASAPENNLELRNANFV